MKKAVYAGIDELNLLRQSEDWLVKSSETSLSELESMDKVNLIVSTEQKLEELLGVAINLGDESLLGEGQDPFLTVTSFIERITEVLPRTDGA